MAVQQEDQVADTSLNAGAAAMGGEETNQQSAPNSSEINSTSTGDSADNSQAPMKDSAGATEQPVVTGETSTSTPTTSTSAEQSSVQQPQQRPAGMSKQEWKQQMRQAQQTNQLKQPSAAAPAVKAAETEQEKAAVAEVLNNSTITGAAKEFQAALAGMKLPPVAVVSLESIKQYENDMKVGMPIHPAMGALHQRSLYMALLAIINNTPVANFNDTFKMLLKIIADNRTGAFGEKYVMRFMPQVRMSKDEMNCFMQLIDMLRTLAPLQGRELALKQVDIHKSLSSTLITDLARSRILAFFN